MSNRLKTLVKFIQAITDQTIEQVAQSINYSRVHLTTEMITGANEGIEKLLTEKYRKEMDEFFGDRDMLLREDSVDYGKRVKIVDAEEMLVADSLIIKGMLRVVLRNQASIIAGQEGVPLSVVMKKISKAVKDETSKELGEL